MCQYEYLWADGVKVKRPMKCSAPDYVNQLFDWIESQVSTCPPQKVDRAAGTLQNLWAAGTGFSLTDQEL